MFKGISGSPRAITPSETKPLYEAESPDELALVETAYIYNCRLIKRTPSSASVSVPGKMNRRTQFY